MRNDQGLKMIGRLGLAPPHRLALPNRFRKWTWKCKGSGLLLRSDSYQLAGFYVNKLNRKFRCYEKVANFLKMSTETGKLIGVSLSV